MTSWPSPAAGTTSGKMSLDVIAADPVMMTSFATTVECDLFAKHGHKENVVAGILIMDDKWNQMVSMADLSTFKTLWETSESTSATRASLDAFNMNVEFMKHDLDAKEKRLQKELDMATKQSIQLKDWPKLPSTSGNAGEKKIALDNYLEAIAFFYDTSLASIRNENAAMVHKAKMAAVGKPKSIDEAIATSYESSAQLAIVVVHDRLKEDDVVRLQEVVASKRKTKTYVETLKLTLEAICTVKAVKSMVWFGQMQARNDDHLGGKTLTYAQARQAFIAQGAEKRKVFGNNDISAAEKLLANLKLFPDDVYEKQGEAAVLNKYWALDYTKVTEATIDALWEEFMRVPCDKGITFNRPRDPAPLQQMRTPSGKSSTMPKSEQRVNRVEHYEGASTPRGEHGKPYIKKCFNCGSSDHLLRECTKKPVCYNCGKEGHIAIDCTEQRSSSRPDSRAATPYRSRSDAATSSRSSSVARSRREPNPSLQGRRPGGSSSYGQPERARKSTSAVHIVRRDDSSERNEPRSVSFCGLCPEGSDSKEGTEGSATAQVNTVSRATPSHIHIDTAANVNVCSPDLLTDLVEADEMLAAFQGEQFAVTQKGVLNVTVEDEFDSSLTHTLYIEMYAMQGVDVPIVSWESMAAGGAELRLKSGCSTIAFNDNNNTIMRIGIDGRIKVTRVLRESDWSVIRRGKAPIKSAMSTNPRFSTPTREQRFAPRGGEQSIRSKQGN
jgi:hypothetical protein